MPLNRDSVVLVFAAILVIAGVLVMSRAWGYWRLNRWCKREGYELIWWRFAWFFEGPRKFLRTDNEEAYRVEIRDRQGYAREGYVVFGSWWWPFSGRTRVEWD